MKLAAAAFDIPSQIGRVLALGLPPVLRAIFAKPSLLLDPVALSRISFASVWVPWGTDIDANARVDKEALITPHAAGTVLDLGAGHGYTANYLDRVKCTRYIALEPNVLMHGQIRAKAQAAGYHEEDGSLLLLICGAEDAATICSSIAPGGQVDTIVSVLTLCTVPAPQQTLHALVHDVLAPGGTLLFYEHVLNPRADVAWWQRFWTPVWRRVFDGCCLDRATHLAIKELRNDDGESVWAEGSVWDTANGLQEGNLFWRQVGRFVKK